MWLQEASIEEILELLALSRERRGNSLSPVSAMIVRKGVTLDPQAMVAHADPRWRRWIVDDWCSLDVEAAFEASREQSREIREMVIGLLGEQDAARALTMFQQERLGRIDQRSELESWVWQERFHADREGALEEALALSSDTSRTNALGIMLATWENEDSGAALSWLESQEALPEKAKLYERLVQGLALDQLPQVQKALAEWPRNPKRALVESEIIKRFAAQDREAAVAMLRGTPEGPYRDFLFGKIVESNTTHEGMLELVRDLDIDLEGLRDLVRIDTVSEHGNSARSRGSWRIRSQLTEALSALGNESPKEAIAMAYELYGSGWAHEDGGEQALAQWVADDPASALTWLMEIPDSEVAARVIRDPFEAWVRATPEEAATFLSNRDLLDLATGSLREALVETWAERGPEELLAWTDSLPEEAQASMMPEALTSIAARHPEWIIDRVDDLPDVEWRQQVAQEVGSALARTDPRTAADWVWERSAEMDLNLTLSQVSEDWVVDEPLAASEWIAALPQGLPRDHAVAGMVLGLMTSGNPNRDLAAAQSWALSVEDVSLRDQLNLALARQLEQEARP